MTIADYVRTGPPPKLKRHRELNQNCVRLQMEQTLHAAMLHKDDAGDKALLASGSPLANVYREIH